MQAHTIQYLTVLQTETSMKHDIPRRLPQGSSSRVQGLQLGIKVFCPQHRLAIPDDQFSSSVHQLPITIHFTSFYHIYVANAFAGRWSELTSFAFVEWMHQPYSAFSCIFKLLLIFSQRKKSKVLLGAVSSWKVDPIPASTPHRGERHFWFRDEALRGMLIGVGQGIADHLVDHLGETFRTECMQIPN